MNGFTPDGLHFLLQDGFGLTRLTLPKAVKTDKAASGDRLSVGAAHVLARSARSGGRQALRALPGLTNVPWTLSHYGEYVLTPDGAHVVEPAQTMLKVSAIGESAQHALEWPEEIPSVGALDLGRPQPAKTQPRSYAVVGEDGTVAVYNPYLRVLRVGHLTAPATLDARWQAECAPTVGELSLFPSATETFVAAYDRGLREAVLYRIDAARTVERAVLPAYGAPTFDGARWCWQSSPTTVCTAPWSDLAHPTQHALPTGVEGPGELSAHRGVMMFVPRDAERIVNVTTGAVIDRKLGAKDAALRARVTDTVRTFDGWLADEGGRLRFGYVEENKQGAVNWSPAFDAGAGTLSALLAVGELLGRQRNETGDPKDLGVASYSMPQGLAPVGLDDVRRAFDALESHQGMLLRACCGMEYPLQSWFEPAYQDQHRVGLQAPPRLFDPRAAAAILRAIMATTAERAAVPLSANVDRWAASPITVDALRGFEHPVPHEGPAVFRGSHALPMITAWIALDALGADAAEVFVRWMVERPTGYAASNPHIVATVVARLIQYHPATRERMHAACHAPGAHREQGQRIWQSVVFEIGG